MRGLQFNALTPTTTNYTYYYYLLQQGQDEKCVLLISLDKLKLGIKSSIENLIKDHCFNGTNEMSMSILSERIGESKIQHYDNRHTTRFVWN